MTKHDENTTVEEWAEDLNFAVAAELWNFPHKYGGSNFSDIRDKEGNFYVDLVLGGGGMLGMVHAGFIHALEESDLRFRAVAGSSAGALSAALLVGMGPDRKWKGILLGALLGALNGDELLDTLTGKFLFRWKFKWRLPFFWLPAAPIAIYMSFKRGLINGNKFQKKLEETLVDLRKNEHGVLDDVGRLRNPPALDLVHVTGEDDTAGLEMMNLTVVASDITMEQKLQYPRDSGRFVNGDKYSVPFWVRASSSVPVVFQPVRMERRTEKPDVRDSNYNPLPYVDIVDGGLMSNFPISVFHRQPEPGTPAALAEYHRQPRLPTFGVQLRPKDYRPNKTHWPWNYASALISSMLDVGDEAFINSNPDYKKVVTIIGVSDVEPFNLYLRRKQKIRLFVRGYVRGKEFLQKFDWCEYKKLRVQMGCEEPID